MKKEAEQKTSKLAIVSSVIGLVNLINNTLSLVIVSNPCNRSLDQAFSSVASLMAVILIGTPFILVANIILSAKTFKEIRKHPRLKGESLASLGTVFSVLSFIILFIVIWRMGGIPECGFS